MDGINATSWSRWNWFHPIIRNLIFEHFLSLGSLLDHSSPLWKLLDHKKYDFTQVRSEGTASPLCPVSSILSTGIMIT
jgi:hypothetical protein